MAKTQGRTGAKNAAKPVDPVKQFMNELKQEVAGDLGLSVAGGDWKQLSAKECGKVGGQMVRRMVQMAAAARLEQ
jgi:small acid-soluble spore protein A (major alpha-type SASP)